MISKEERNIKILGALGKSGYPVIEDSYGSVDSENQEFDTDLISSIYLWYDLETLRIVDDKKIDREFNTYRKGIRMSEKQTRPYRSRSTLHKVLNAAAMISIGALLAFLTYYLVEKQKRDQLSDQFITVPYGSKIQFNLADGTIVDLNAGSNLTYNKEFGRRNREVQLEGEAFFNVSHSENKVFTVKTRDMIVSAYGTSFNVKSYPDEPRTEATLVEGIIGIEKPGVKSRRSDNLVLNPGERIVYHNPANIIKGKEDQIVKSKTKSSRAIKNEKSQVIVSKGINTDIYTSWREGRLILNSEPLSEMAIKLERKYDVEIEIEDQDLKEYRFTGTFEKETIEQVLEAIKIASQIDYLIEDRNITLLPSNK